MIDRLQISQKGAEIIRPYAESFIQRYSNKYNQTKGSRYINNTPCPLCRIHLNNGNCGACPMDQVFGCDEKESMDESGCKVFIRIMWGSIKFGDFPHNIIRTEKMNTQLHQINKWLVSTFR